MKSFIVIIKKSPIVIVRNFIILEILGYGAFLATGLLADYNHLYNQYPFAQIVSYRVAEFAFIIFIEILITLFIFFHWFFEYYRLANNQFLYSSGVFRRRKTIQPLHSLELIRQEYGFLGKIFGYGTLIFHNQETQKEIKMIDIPTPQKYAAIIKKLKKASENQSVKHSRPVLFNELRDIEVKNLINSAENEFLEFKSTLRWDKAKGCVNRLLEKAVMKTIAAFLNSEGGSVIIGVNDDRTVSGLKADYQSLTRPNADGFENHFTLVFNNSIGVEFRRYIKLHFKNINNEEICVVQVTPSDKPVYLVSDNIEEFYIRTGNSTTALRISQVASYLDLWRRKE